MRILVCMLVVTALLMAPKIWLDSRQDHAVPRLPSAAYRNASPGRIVYDDQTGTVLVDGTALPLSDIAIRRSISKRPPNTQSYIVIWDWLGIKEVTASARGLDGKHYIANSFLVGFKPFHTDKIWVPLYTIAMRKHYVKDDQSYAGLQDIWQNSRQGFYQRRGDCEDHAIVLADWLIELGVDARVVLGTHKGEEHAWVVAIIDDKEYLLEATSKRRSTTWASMPLAKLALGYRPKFQFNREYFWSLSEEGHESVHIGEYRGELWNRKSRFVSSKNI
ncbi:transglutaminase domain-containing protein [Biformimicrobium ophioploci]|uniref:Transglutaminase-like domain-containing protein n=1 Tax=Biformimicrobium ophioploci TaxID=3036711 RepID=A0ABQ6LX49_9GAMM|nr:transglutaminase domain-containing protein [Microbulbifer sp. NKW57]GMG86670.1 hypothetical protein MNKW57_09910 [Microbulbifer sp. NKW57]